MSRSSARWLSLTALILTGLLTTGGPALGQQCGYNNQWKLEITFRFINPFAHDDGPAHGDGNGPGDGSGDGMMPDGGEQPGFFGRMFRRNRNNPNADPGGQMAMGPGGPMSGPNGMMGPGGPMGGEPPQGVRPVRNWIRQQQPGNQGMMPGRGPMPMPSPNNQAATPQTPPAVATTNPMQAPRPYVVPDASRRGAALWTRLAPPAPTAPPTVPAPVVVATEVEQPPVVVTATSRPAPPAAAEIKPQPVVAVSFVAPPTGEPSLPAPSASRQGIVPHDNPTPPVVQTAPPDDKP